MPQTSIDSDERRGRRGRGPGVVRRAISNVLGGILGRRGRGRAARRARSAARRG